MIVGKLWRAFSAQANELANFLWQADPIAQMQYEYDRIVDQLKEGREGLEQYRALVERVARQVNNNRKQAEAIGVKVKTYLNAGDRETAGKFAIELQKVRKELAENEQQLALHEKAYENHLKKIKHASGKLTDLREKIHKYDADLKMSRAEAELAKVAREFNFDVTTNTGAIEVVIQEQIDKNRARAKVAADLSGEGMEDIDREQAMESTMAEQALLEFEQHHNPKPDWAQITDERKR